MDYSLPWDQVNKVDYSLWRGERLAVDKLRQTGQLWAESNPTFKKIKEETAKARIRAKQTNVAVYLEGMWKDRQELAATRKEAQAAGLLRGEDGDDGPASEEKKLDEQVATDPYIQIAQFLLKEGAGGGVVAKGQ